MCCGSPLHAIAVSGAVHAFRIGITDQTLVAWHYPYSLTCSGKKEWKTLNGVYTDRTS